MKPSLGLRKELNLARFTFKIDVYAESRCKGRRAQGGSKSGDKRGLGVRPLGSDESWNGLGVCPLVPFCPRLRCTLRRCASWNLTPFLRTAQLNVKVRQNNAGRPKIRAMCWQTDRVHVMLSRCLLDFFCQFACKKSCNPIYPHDVVEYGI